jgi:hypothetical protein
MANKINTIQELENLFYGSGVGEVMKDAPVLTSTTGVYNAVYGQLVWSLVNQEANVFGLLPKTPWRKSGWRLMTAAATSSGYGGVSEGGNIPATIKPSWVEVSNTLKTVAHAFDVSEVEEYLSDKDDAIGDMEYMREIMGVKHKEDMNKALLADASAEAAAATGN